jgi:uncharacterized protein YigA (DUF484 family)
VTKQMRSEMQSKKTQQDDTSSESQLLSLLRKNLDILIKHPELLVELEIPHQAGDASSLIERQVNVLRDNLKNSEKRLRRLMDIARDNERLAKSRHRIAVNLLGAHDLDDVISIVLDELKNELKAEFVDIKLISNNKEMRENHPDLFVTSRSAKLKEFSTMLKHKNPVCGRCSQEQKDFLFGNSAEEVASAAVIPLVAGADLGLLGLGGRDPDRFQTSMGTEFLTQVGELVSATLAVHLEK